MAEAMYAQIADDLRAKINAGELAGGDKLKPEAGLQDEYSERPEFSSSKVSRNTVRDAIELLVLEGLVEKRPGQGTYVVQAIDAFVTSLTAEQSTGVSQSTSYASEVAASSRKAAFTVSPNAVYSEPPTIAGPVFTPAPIRRAPQGRSAGAP